MTAMPERFNVGGILLDQPFKIRRLGHFGFNLVNMDEGVRFYIDWLGFRVRHRDRGLYIPSYTYSLTDALAGPGPRRL